MSPQEKLRLKIAIATYGHTAALKKGEVPIEGVDADFLEISPIIAAFRRMVRDVEFDVCEMAPATYMIARAAGAPFKALPVFVFRRFHHEGLVCHPDAHIAKPTDLHGKKVGVRAYSVSTGIWTRGILSDDYGVDNSKITWMVDDEEHVKSLKLPDNVVHTAEGDSLVSMMDEGKLAACFTGNAGLGRSGAPKEGWTGAPAAKKSYPELIADAPAKEKEWFARTGIYPVHGLVVVKDELLERHPWLARSLCDAFETSKQRYVQQLQRGEVNTDTDRHYQKMSAIVGDPLPMGMQANLPAIEALIRYSYEQGLLPRAYAARDMFADNTAA